MAKPTSKNKNTTAAPPEGALVGTEGADIIGPGTGPVASTDGADVIWSLGGDDEVDGGPGDDVIEAGAGDDTLYGGDGNDILNGGDGSDVIVPGAGSDTIDGGSGDGIDVVIYEGLEGVDYEVLILTELVGNGRKQREEVVGFEVTDLATGEIDYLTNVDQVLFIQTPQEGTIVTASDFAYARFDGTANVNVLANDYLEGGEFGEGMTLTAILDVQIDLNVDGVNDVDLIPDGQPLSYYETGDLLNDGSILTVAADGTVAWDPNGVYDSVPGIGEDAPSVYFWYEASNGMGGTAYGDVAFQVTYPTPPGDIAFEDMVSVYDPFTAAVLGLWVYQDGPDGKYWVSQLTSATNYFEQRDASVPGYDYDGDGDAEFRVWTDAVGTTHEMNVTHSENIAFDLGGMTFTGLDDGETAQIVISDLSGNAQGQVTITNADLDQNGVLEITNAFDVAQFNVVAGVGSNFYVDDVFFL